MNAGFSNLAFLKGQVLAASSLQADTRWDARLATVGQGVARGMENHCQRKFARATGDTEIIAADRIQFLLSRFPVEAVTKIEVKETERDGWVEKTVNDFVRTIDLKAGIVYTPEGADVGDRTTQVRFTYTGGYFWETAEPTDNPYPTTVPAGAALLPEDVLMAWVLQCQRVWETIDKIGGSILSQGGDAKSDAVSLAELKMVPEVKRMLRQYVREQWV